MTKTFQICCVCWILMLAGFTITRPLSAQTQRYQFDDTVYPLPKNWKKGKTNADHAIIYQADSGLKTICIFRSAAPPRNRSRWINEKVEFLMDDDEIEKAKKMPSTSIPAGKHSLTIGATLSGHTAWLAVANFSQQKANIVIMKSRVPRDEKGRDEFSEIMKKEFLPFAMELKYISQGAKPVLGRPERGDLEGTYTGLKHAYKLDMSTSLEQEFYTFSKSGRFLRGLPKGTSIEKIDFKAAMNEMPNRAGNYHIGRNKIRFAFADGTVSKTDFEMTDKGFKLKQQYTRVNAPDDGTKFDGLFRALNYSAFTPSVGVSGGVVNQRSLRFTESGHFTATQFSGASGNFENATGDTTGGFNTSTKRPKTEGTYKVHDGTLVLTDDQGHVSVSSLMRLGERLIFVDGRQFLKTE